MGKYKKLLQNVGIMTMGNFSSRILVFLMVPLYTSVLSAAEYGIYDLSVSTVQLLMPVLSLNISDAVMRFVMDGSISHRQTVAVGCQHTLGSFAAAGLIFGVCYCTGCFQLIHGYELYILGYYVFYEWNQFSIQLAKGLERLGLIAFSAVLGTAVMLGANILFLLVIRIGLPGFFLANILAQAVPALYLTFRLKMWRYAGRKMGQTDPALRRGMLAYSVPLIATAIGWWANSTADKYVVTFLCGAAANGLLSVAYKIPGIINTVQGIFIQAWQVSAIREYENCGVQGSGGRAFYNTTFLYLNMLMCFTCALLILLVKPIAGIMYSKDFYAAWHYVPFLLVSSVLNAASGYIGPILAARKNSRAMAGSAVYGTLANVFLNIVLVLAMGVQGAAVATALSSFIIYAVRKRAVGDVLGDMPGKKTFWKIPASWALLSTQAFMEVYADCPAGHAAVLLGLVWLYWDGWRKLMRKARAFCRKEGTPC